MVNIISRLIDLLFCKHEWVFVQRVEKDYNLRTGRVGPSAVSKCRKCGKHSTLEIE